MILTVLLLTVVSTCLAQPADDNAQQRPARAPQSQIQYRDPDGSRVDWRFRVPKIYGDSRIASARRAERAETGSGQANFGAQKQPRVVQAPMQQETQYQPYSAIPNHIKQLLVQSYAPQGPYVDPGAFFHQAHAPIAAPLVSPVKVDRSAVPRAQLGREYFNKAAIYGARGDRPADQQTPGQIGRVPSSPGGIKYKDEDRSSAGIAKQLPYGSVIPAQSQPKPRYQPYKQIAQYKYQQYDKQASQAQPHYRQYKKQVSQAQTHYQSFNKEAPQPELRYKQYKAPGTVEPRADPNRRTPMAIQQLLRYQAQLPYNVIANHILYRPKQPFIPKPLPESVKIGRQYPSKVYFVKKDGQIYESSDTVKDGGAEKRY